MQHCKLIAVLDIIINTHVLLQHLYIVVINSKSNETHVKQLETSKLFLSTHGGYFLWWVCTFHNKHEHSWKAMFSNLCMHCILLHYLFIFKVQNNQVKKFNCALTCTGITSQHVMQVNNLSWSVSMSAICNLKSTLYYQVQRLTRIK